MTFFSVSAEVLSTQWKAKPVASELMSSHLVQRIKLNERGGQQRAPVIGELRKQLTFVLPLTWPIVRLLTLELVERGAKRVAHRVCKLRVAAALVFSDLRLVVHDVLGVLLEVATAVIAGAESEAEALRMVLAKSPMAHVVPIGMQHATS